MEVFAKTAEQLALLSAVLSSHSLFAHLDDRELPALVMAFRPEIFQAGEYVYRQGDYHETSDSLYVILEGDCEVLQDDKVDSTLGTCDIFGEQAVMYCQAREQSVRATSTVEAFSLGRQTFQLLMNSTFLKKRELYCDLLQVGFLKNLTPAERLQVADALEPQNFQDGEPLISYGEEGQWFYILMEGHVDVFGRDSGGVVLHVCSFGPGDFVGELEFIHNHLTVADVKSKGACRTVRMNRAHFELCMGPVRDILARHSDANNPTYNYYNATQA